VAARSLSTIRSTSSPSQIQKNRWGGGVPPPALRRCAARTKCAHRRTASKNEAPAFPPWAPSTKGMRITPVIEGMVIPQVTRVVHRSRSGPAPRGRACSHRTGTGARCEWQWLPLPQNAPAVSQRYPLVAEAHLARAFVVNTHRAFGSASPSFPRGCAPCRASQIRSGIFPHPSQVWQLFPAFPLRSPPLHSIALRSSGGELRGAPLSVNALG
jgi:hypothetical protein